MRALARTPAVMIDKVCHLETALLYSQGRSNVIAASDSVKIQFNLRHRGHRMCNRMLGMYNLPHCLKTRISPLCRPSHRMLCVPQHASNISLEFPPAPQVVEGIFILSFFDLWFYVSLGRGSINFRTLRGKLQLHATLATQPRRFHIKQLFSCF